MAHTKLNTFKDSKDKVDRLRLEDLAGNALISPNTQMTVTDVANWVESLGFPQYKVRPQTMFSICKVVGLNRCLIDFDATIRKSCFL